jgi:hypothetical protein
VRNEVRERKMWLQGLKPLFVRPFTAGLKPRPPYLESSQGKRATAQITSGLNLEARVGIEPTYKGFADLSLTTWVPRPETTV